MCVNMEKILYLTCTTVRPPPPTALLLSPNFNKVSHYYINLPMLLSFTCPTHVCCCSFNPCCPIELLHMIKAVSIMIIPFRKTNMDTKYWEWGKKTCHNCDHGGLNGEVSSLIALVFKRRPSRS